MDLQLFSRNNVNMSRNVQLILQYHEVMSSFFNLIQDLCISEEGCMALKIGEF